MVYRREGEFHYVRRNISENKRKWFHNVRRNIYMYKLSRIKKIEICSEEINA